jgi:hypothetical protein
MQYSKDGCNLCLCVTGAWACTLHTCENSCPPPIGDTPTGCGGSMQQTYAKSPVTGACCAYMGEPSVEEGYQCGGPTEWDWYTSETECITSENALPRCEPGSYSNDGGVYCSCSDARFWHCDTAKGGAGGI